MSRVIVVGCGAKKIWSRPFQPRLVPAQDAYTSGFFTAKRRYVEAHGPDQPWMIMSAKYGLLQPTDKIANYDASFTNGTGDLKAFRYSMFMLQPFDEIEMLLSGAYARLLLQGLEEVDWAPPPDKIHWPLKGMGLYQMTAWLKRRTDELWREML